jgi:hypothetical protein
VGGQSNGANRVQALYRLILGRPATNDEVALARQFISAAPSFDELSKLSPWELYAQALISSNEFLFID